VGVSSVVYEGRFIIALRRDRWEYVSRKGTTGVVIIVATTPADELLFVEQHRTPVDARVIELPAGLAGDIAGQEDEALELAAARELEEETGWRPAHVQRLVSGPVSAGLTTEIVTFFRATALERVSDGGGDEHEDIVVHAVPLPEVEAWLAAKMAAGVLVDPKVYSALWFTRHPPA